MIKKTKLFVLHSFKKFLFNFLVRNLKKNYFFLIKILPQLPPLTINRPRWFANSFQFMSPYICSCKISLKSEHSNKTSSKWTHTFKFEQIVFVIWRPQNKTYHGPELRSYHEHLYNSFFPIGATIFLVLSLGFTMLTTVTVSSP